LSDPVLDVGREKADVLLNHPYILNLPLVAFCLDAAVCLIIKVAVSIQIRVERKGRGRRVHLFIVFENAEHGIRNGLDPCGGGNRNKPHEP
jgi:hypothetical protein